MFKKFLVWDLFRQNIKLSANNPRWEGKVKAHGGRGRKQPMVGGAGKDHGRRGRKKALLGGADIAYSNWSEPLSKRLGKGVPG